VNGLARLTRHVSQTVYEHGLSYGWYYSSCPNLIFTVTEKLKSEHFEQTTAGARPSLDTSRRGPMRLAPTTSFQLRRVFLEQKTIMVGYLGFTLTKAERP
jgi:hypothetical protein